MFSNFLPEIIPSVICNKNDTKIRNPEIDFNQFLTH